MKTYVGMVTDLGSRVHVGSMAGRLRLTAEVKVEVHSEAGPVYLATRPDAWSTWSAPDLLALTAVDDPTISTIWDDMAAERKRAHALHGPKSMEDRAPADESRLRILTEELGEVAREFNEAELDGRPVDLFNLRDELVQLGAMAAAWADVLPRDPAERTGTAPAPQWTEERLREWFTSAEGENDTYPFLEDDDANIHGYGHQDKETFAREVNRFDIEVGGVADDEAGWTSAHVTHKWAVMDPDGEKFWVNVPASEERVEHLLLPGPVGPDTPGAFPITCLWGQR